MAGACLGELPERLAPTLTMIVKHDLADGDSCVASEKVTVRCTPRRAGGRLYMAAGIWWPGAAAALLAFCLASVVDFQHQLLPAR